MEMWWGIHVQSYCTVELSPKWLIQESCTIIRPTGVTLPLISDLVMNIRFPWILLPTGHLHYSQQLGFMSTLLSRDPLLNNKQDDAPVRVAELQFASGTA